MPFGEMILQNMTKGRQGNITLGGSPGPVVESSNPSTAWMDRVSHFCCCKKWTDVSKDRK